MPATAREFWAYVDRMSDDEDLGAASFLEAAHRRHFYFGIADGVKAGFMHFRQCDAHLNAQGGRKIASAYDAIGAAQVAKASFSGMRLMHRIDGKVAIWPMDPLPERGSVVVEIYTRIYLRRAGMRGTEAQDPRRAQPRSEGPWQPARAAPLRTERPSDRRFGDRCGNAPAGHDRATGIRARGADAPHRPDRRLDVRRSLTQTRVPAAGLAQG